MNAEYVCEQCENRVPAVLLELTTRGTQGPASLRADVYCENPVHPSPPQMKRVVEVPRETTVD
jgi:proline-rich tail region repeat protein